jgi:hypothetical protein
MVHRSNERDLRRLLGAPFYIADRKGEADLPEPLYQALERAEDCIQRSTGYGGGRRLPTDILVMLAVEYGPQGPAEKAEPAEGTEGEPVAVAAAEGEPEAVNAPF